MHYQHYVFDIDGTLLDTEETAMRSLQVALREIDGREAALEELRFTFGITGRDALRALGVTDVERGFETWVRHYDAYRGLSRVFGGIPALLGALRDAGKTLGIITSKNRQEYFDSFLPFGLGEYFPVFVSADDTVRHKPDGEPMLHYLSLAGARPEETLYIGDSRYDIECAGNAGVDAALALWGGGGRHPGAAYYLETPADLLAL